MNFRKYSTDKAWFFDGYSEEECFLLRQSWVLASNQVDRIGKETFSNLFVAHKDAFLVFIEKKVMTPKTPKDIEYNWETKVHSQRVLAAMEKCIYRIDQAEAFLVYVGGLAARHASNGTKTSHILAMLSCLRRAIFDVINEIPDEIWLSDVKIQDKDIHSDDEEVSIRQRRTYAVWDKFFMTLSLCMINGIEQSKRLVCHRKSMCEHLVSKCSWIRDRRSLPHLYEQESIGQSSSSNTERQEISNSAEGINKNLLETMENTLSLDDKQ